MKLDITARCTSQAPAEPRGPSQPPLGQASRVLLAADLCWQPQQRAVHGLLLPPEAAAVPGVHVGSALEDRQRSLLPCIISP